MSPEENFKVETALPTKMVKVIDYDLLAKRLQKGPLYFKREVAVSLRPNLYLAMSRLIPGAKTSLRTIYLQKGNKLVPIGKLSLKT